MLRYSKTQKEVSGYLSRAKTCCLRGLSLFCTVNLKCPATFDGADDQDARNLPPSAETELKITKAT